MAECKVCGDKIPEGKVYCSDCDPGIIVDDDEAKKDIGSEIEEDEGIKEIKQDFGDAKVEKKKDKDTGTADEEDKSYFPESDEGGESEEDSSDGAIGL